MVRSKFREDSPLAAPYQPSPELTEELAQHGFRARVRVQELATSKRIELRLHHEHRARGGRTEVVLSGVPIDFTPERAGIDQTWRGLLNSHRRVIDGEPNVEGPGFFEMMFGPFEGSRDC